MRLGAVKQAPNWLVGLVLVIVLAIGAYVAYTKNVPFTGGTTFEVAFDDAQNLRKNSPVRIAGVEVGTVKSVEPLPPGEPVSQTAQADAGSEGAGADDSLEPGGGVATLEFQDAGLPLKEDATFKLRPRLFLEGNLFVDVKPGSPTAAEVEGDHVFPPTQTANTVQLDEILTASLQEDSRESLQTFLDEFGTTLIDEGGAKSLRTIYRSSAGAFRSGAQVNEAALGRNPRDLSELIGNLDRTIRGLNGNERALQDTVTNLMTVTGSLAAEDDALERAVFEIPQVLDAADPAFVSLNAAFPPLRAFAREALPGTRSTPETLRATRPLLQQVRGLSRPAELRGLVADLRPTVPQLAKLTRRTVPFLEETRALSSCFNEVIIPWSNDSPVGLNGYPHNTDDEVFKETAYGFAGLNGESRSQDANGQYIRIAGAGGTNTVAVNSEATGETLAGVTQRPIQGAMPAIEDSAKTPYRPDQPCENQDPPDLRANGGVPPNQSTDQGGGLLEDLPGLDLPDPPIDPSAPIGGPITVKGEQGEEPAADDGDASPQNSASEIGEAAEDVWLPLLQAAGLREQGDAKAAKKAQREAEKQTAKFYDRFSK